MVKSLEAVALQAYIIRDGLCHPDFLEEYKYKRIYTMLKWKYRKIWKQITAKVGRPLHKALHGQDDYIMKLFNELEWAYMSSHCNCGVSFFEDDHFYTMRELNCSPTFLDKIITEVMERKI